MSPYLDHILGEPRRLQKQVTQPPSDSILLDGDDEDDRARRTMTEQLKGDLRRNLKLLIV